MKTRRWTLLDVSEDTRPPATVAGAGESLEHWLRQLGLEDIALERRFEGIALKQFRDATEADRACYQALVKLERKFTDLPRMAWIEENLKVTIYEFDTMQIAKKFGLLGGTPRVDRRGRPGVMFEPEKPFWVQADMEQGLGTNLCWRAGAMEWQRG
jgi:hypothetical protein